MEMQTLAFPLIYLMVAINPGTEQWEAVNSEGAFDDTEPTVYTDQKACLADRQEMTTPGLYFRQEMATRTYFCLAYKDPRYMMESLEKGHWLPLSWRGMPYGAGHGVDNASYPSKKACLAARQKTLAEDTYRCVPYSDSYVDKDDPPPWTLQFRDRPRERSSWRARWFYTRAECLEMGRYMIGRYRNVQPEATFECIHSQVQKSGRSQ
jgi:hypothetical protein